MQTSQNTKSVLVLVHGSKYVLPVHGQSIRIKVYLQRESPKRENDDDKMYSCKKCDGKMCPPPNSTCNMISKF